MNGKKDKILIVFLIILVVVTLLLTVIFLKYKLQPVKNKTDNKIVVTDIEEDGNVQDVLYNDFKITDIKYVVNEELKSTEIVLNINNTSGEKKYLKSFDVIIKDSSNERIDKLYVYLDREFEIDEQFEYVTMTDDVIDNASFLEFNFE